MTMTSPPHRRSLAQLRRRARARSLLLRGAEPPRPRARAAPPPRAPRTPTPRSRGCRRRARRAARAAPRVALAGAYLQRARETGDPGFYARADGLLRGRSRAPGDPARSSRAPGSRSRATTSAAGWRSPGARGPRGPGARAVPALVDALVELGRFGAAERTLQRLVDAKPTLAGYARVSYLRELHGDLDGAVAAMRRAVAAGGPARESVASVQALLGGLELARGRLAAARARVPRGARRRPGLPRRARPGSRGSRAARGDLDGAIRRWRALVGRGCRCPST